jgi:thiol:disulfide interchange protein DsbA
MRATRLFVAGLIGLAFVPLGHSAIVEGHDYTTLAAPQPVEPGKKVEVIDFFAYYSSPSYTLDVYLTAWAKTNADKIVLERVPVSLNGQPMAQQRLYYTLEAMGVVEQYHPKVFDAMNTGHIRVNTDDDAINLAVDLGLNRDRFASLYNSPTVQTKVQRALQMMTSYGVNSWPTLIIDGKYSTSPAMASASSHGDGSEAAAAKSTLNVVDQLVGQQLKTGR